MRQIHPETLLRMLKTGPLPVEEIAFRLYVPRLRVQEALVRLKASGRVRMATGGTNALWAIVEAPAPDTFKALTLDLNAHRNLAMMGRR